MSIGSLTSSQRFKEILRSFAFGIVILSDGGLLLSFGEQVSLAVSVAAITTQITGKSLSYEGVNFYAQYHGLNW